MEILSNDGFMLHCVFLFHLSPLIFQWKLMYMRATWRLGSIPSPR